MLKLTPEEGFAVSRTPWAKVLMLILIWVIISLICQILLASCWRLAWGEWRQGPPVCKRLSDGGYWSLNNSLAPGTSECDYKNVIFNLVLLIGIFRSSHDNALRWMPQDRTDNKSTLVQVMAWCRQATSHYLSQCWPRSLSPYDVTRP